VSRYWQLLLLRMLTSISIGGALPLVCSLVGDLFFVQQRTGVMACVQVAVAAGLVLGHALAGFVGAPALSVTLTLFVTITLPLQARLAVGRLGVPTHADGRAPAAAAAAGPAGSCAAAGSAGVSWCGVAVRSARAHRHVRVQASRTTLGTAIPLLAWECGRVSAPMRAHAARRFGLGLALAVRAGRAAGAGGGGADAGHHARAAARLHRGGAQRAPPLPRTPALPGRAVVLEHCLGVEVSMQTYASVLTLCSLICRSARTRHATARVALTAELCDEWCAWCSTGQPALRPSSVPRGARRAACPRTNPLTGHPRAQGAYASAGFQYSERISLRKAAALARTRSNLAVVLQGLPGSLPWGVLITFLNDFLSQQKGLTVPQATSVRARRRGRPAAPPAPVRLARQAPAPPARPSPTGTRSAAWSAAPGVRAVQATMAAGGTGHRNRGTSHFIGRRRWAWSRALQRTGTGAPYPAPGRRAERPCSRTP